ncbi:MAG: lysoplasmalogenase [Burkholderiaceae bacterium]
MTGPAWLLVGVCVLAVAALLLAEWHEHRRARALFKMLASTAFVALALISGALDSDYGRWVLAALCLGWLGDALLLSSRQSGFLAGLAAFLFSHLCFAAAFLGATQDRSVALISAALLMLVGGAVMRWLGPHLSASFKLPVLSYVLAILLMVAASMPLGINDGHWQPVLGAVAFAASDLAVARDRFVKAGFVNPAWGLPAYYGAQLLMAASLTVVPAAAAGFAGYH